ncbi:GAF domain-containing protein [uncultured Sphingomonas sp.]|uniref:GAF domain-containing protein n=1 Tax=uncultured Sphingomonas sp. TaxID=158754 RepID=UPI0025D8883E|nr:GAF domain-containing protein [uncultured Sphingomonas sp.]
MSFFAPAKRPANERDRQRAVDQSGVLTAPPDATLHSIVTRAARLYGAPMAAVSIIDRHRQWFAARIGLALPEMSRDISFCAHAILQPGEPMVIADAMQDDRFAGNPLVQELPWVRFYVGAPLGGAGHLPIGTLCVLDRVPRPGEVQTAGLIALARQASAAIEELGHAACT